MQTYSAAEVSGILLAGGRARRMGGEDKGLLPAAGKTLAEWTAAKLRRQTAEIIVSANRNISEYAKLGKVARDMHAGFCGPLAGVCAGLRAAKTAWAVSVPCDSPFFPDALAATLFAAAQKHNADVVSARAGGRAQPVFMLLRASLADSLSEFLDGGGRKIDMWQAEQNHCFSEFADGAAFDNINTPEELAAAARRLGGG